MSWSLLSEQFLLCTQAHSSAYKSALVQGSCRSLREKPIGFPRIPSLKGRPLCHHLYLGGVAITWLGSSLVGSTSLVGPGPECPSPSWHLCAVGVYCAASAWCLATPHMGPGTGRRLAWVSQTGRVSKSSSSVLLMLSYSPIYNPPCSGLGCEGD